MTASPTASGFLAPGVSPPSSTVVRFHRQSEAAGQCTTPNPTHMKRQHGFALGANDTAMCPTRARPPRPAPVRTNARLGAGVASALKCATTLSATASVSGVRGRPKPPMTAFGSSRRRCKYDALYSCAHQTRQPRQKIEHNPHVSTNGDQPPPQANATNTRPLRRATLDTAHARTHQPYRYTFAATTSTARHRGPSVALIPR